MYVYFDIFHIHSDVNVQDILVLGRTEAICRKNVNLVLHMLKTLGFIISPTKCVLEPSTTFEYLGVRWNTADWTVGLKVICCVMNIH